MPAAFALGVRVGNAQTATFAAFGAFALLLLFDPPGPRALRLTSYLTLAGAGTISIVLATLCARTTVTAVAGMAVVAFGVLMLASLGSYAAGATTALLLTFILPVSLPIPWDQLPPRIGGWALAVALAVPASLLLWPPPAGNPLREAAATACRRIGLLLGAAGAIDATEPEAAVAAREAAARLQERFRTAPARPGGTGEADRALAILVDEIDWIAVLADDLAAADASGHPCRGEIRDELAVAGELLAECGDVLGDVREGAAGERQDERLRTQVAALTAARAKAADATLARLGAGGPGPSLVTAQDLSFVARALGFGAQSVAEHVLQVRAGSGWQGLAGWRRWGRVAWTETRKRLLPGSPVLHSSIRAAVALGASVLLTLELDVQRGFWVILGTLSVLRSTAVGTGANALRAVAGTAIGFAVGSALLLLVGTSPRVLWVLLPVAVLVAGVAPAVISFTVGQAAFTVVVVVLFNILAPTGWKVGLLRIEDVALGCAVSVVVGGLFWPRGLVTAFGAALDEAYVAAADRVRRTVLQLTGDRGASPAPAQRRYATARRRLDDAFRLFLAEQGTRLVPLADATNLAAAASRLRLVGDSLAELAEDGMAGGVDGGVAEARLREAAGALDLWYRELGDAVAGRRPDVPEAEGLDPSWGATLLAALRDGDAGPDPGAHRARALMVVWTAQHLDSARRREADVAASAGALAAARSRWRWS